MSLIVYTMDPLDQAASDAVLQMGQRIRRLRDDAGWSIAELALRCYLTVDVLAAVEVGDADLGLSELSRLAAALEVPLSTLVG